MKTSAKVDGLRELQQRLRALSEDMQKKIPAQATSAAAVIVKKAAIALAPKDTGQLRSHIVIKRLPPGERTATSQHIVTVKKIKRKYANTKRNRQTNRVGKTYQSDVAYYWRHLEFGTAKMAARPFMRPAFEQNKERAKDAIIDRIRKRIERAERGSKT